MSLQTSKSDKYDLEKLKETLKETPLKWESMECELMTPMHGGGVKARLSDMHMPVRVTSIRGQLRFWWRLLAKYKWHYSNDELRAKEFLLWGGMSKGDEGGHASLVFLRIKMNNKLIEAPLNDYAKSINDPLGYALFTAKKTKSGLPEMKLGKEGLKWCLEWRFDQRISDMQREEVRETLRWWATLGGLGGRTRRGCGAFYVQGFKPVTEKEMKEVGCRILFLGEPQNQARKAWIEAIDTWKVTRQNHKTSFRKLLGKNDENSRHLATVLSRPVFDGHEWRGMIIVLPNSSSEIKEILKG